MRAVGAGRRRGAVHRWRRVEVRYVDLSAGRHLQVTHFDATQAFTANYPAAEAADAVDRLLAEPWANWHAWTTSETFQLRVTKKGEALSSSRPPEDSTALVPDREHDRAKQRLLAADDPVLAALGIADAQGRIKPTRQAKYRQVEEFVRRLDAAVDAAVAAGSIPQPTEDEPLQVVDLGCGNAYLTFAAHRYLSAVKGLPVRLTGIDVKEQSLRHNTEVAATLGVDAQVQFVQATIGSTDLPRRPHVVLALHACDTATDDALAQAVQWEAPLILAAPCCHHDVATQIKGHAAAGTAPAPYASLVRDGILRERFADTLTDALRASALRLRGYRVEVMEFVESQHTPRNTMLQAVRTGAPATDEARGELETLTRDWQLKPRLHDLLT